MDREAPFQTIVELVLELLAVNVAEPIPHIIKPELFTVSVGAVVF